MTITSSQLYALSPLLIIGLTILVLLLSIAYRRNYKVSAGISGVGLLLALFSIFFARQFTPCDVTELLSVDTFALSYMTGILIIAIVTIPLAVHWLADYPDNKDEFFLLMLIATLGAVTLTMAVHAATLFIGIELLSLPLFGLIGYNYRRSNSIEASLKYMILSAAASAFLLLGIAILYALSGQLSFAGIVNTTLDFSFPMLLVGVGLMLVGLCFKLSLAPFQLWTPDVYQGANVPAGLFVSTLSKVAIFGVVVRFFLMNSLTQLNSVYLLLVVIAILSILFGNLVAVSQRNVKRLMGYSSIAHIGYILTAVIAIEQVSYVQRAVLVYLVGYVLSNIVIFGVMSLYSKGNSQDKELFSDYKGLFWRNPTMALCFAVALLSLAGIPLTIGFFGKYYVIIIGVLEGLHWLLAAVVLGSALGLYYYMKLLVLLFMKDDSSYSDEPVVVSSSRVTKMIESIVLIAAVLIVLLGLYPEPLLSVIHPLYF